jgi:hypothetical protein
MQTGVVEEHLKEIVRGRIPLKARLDLRGKCHSDDQAKETRSNEQTNDPIHLTD